MKKVILISLCTLLISTLLPQRASAGVGYWDLFCVSLTPNGPYWNQVNGGGGGGVLGDPLVAPAPSGGSVIDAATPLGGIAWGFGGFDWGTGTLEACAGQCSIQLKGVTNYVLSITLDSDTTPAANGNFPSWGTFSNIKVYQWVAGAWVGPININGVGGPAPCWVKCPHRPAGETTVVGGLSSTITLANNEFGSGEFGPGVPPQPRGVWGAAVQLPPAAGYFVCFTYKLFTWDSYGLGGVAPPPPACQPQPPNQPPEPNEIKWIQWPDLSYTGMDVNATEPMILADDWPCDEEGLVTDIHIWGSWKDDYVDPNVKFTLSIHNNNPGPPSSPNELLWQRTFGPNEYSVEMDDYTEEGWYDPDFPYEWYPANHNMAFKYNFFLKPYEFWQEPGTIYWLNVQAHPNDPCAFFGWKTSLEHWMDDAVWGKGQEPYTGTWTPMYYPPDHPLPGTIDLAFAITGHPDPCYPNPKNDLGDAPDSSNNAGMNMTAYPAGGPPGILANFPSVYVTGSPPHGPRHQWPALVAYLGPAVTFEIEADIGPDNDGMNNINSGGDMPDQDLADDGVLNMPLNLPHCKAATFKYQVNVIFPGVDLWANVWFDWNRDGDFDDTLDCSGTAAPEWAVQNQFLSGLPAGLNIITTPLFLPWHSASDPNEIWMRITLSEQFWNGGSGSGGSGPAAGYLYGETEDYYFDPNTNCSECPDLNCDGIVNFVDFAVMANLWLQSCP